MLRERNGAVSVDILQVVSGVLGPRLAYAWDRMATWKGILALAFLHLGGLLRSEWK